MKIYEYSHTCNECNKEWSDKRLKPYKYAIKTKTCPMCRLKKGETYVEDMGGLDGTRSCGSCQHFEPYSSTNDAWGRCNLGHKLSNEVEYTLTYAIDNLDCGIEPDEHEEYGADIYGLVHDECLCPKFEEVSDGIYAN